MDGEAMVHAAGNASNGNLNGPETNASILDNEKSKQKQKSIYFKHIHFLAATKQL